MLTLGQLWHDLLLQLWGLGLLMEGTLHFPFLKPLELHTSEACKLASANGMEGGNNYTYSVGVLAVYDTVTCWEHRNRTLRINDQFLAHCLSPPPRKRRPENMYTYSLTVPLSKLGGVF